MSPANNDSAKNIAIEFGALADPIKDQLKRQGISIPDEESQRFEKIAYSIVFLHLQDIIPDSVRDKSREKLMKRISNAIHRGADP